MAGDLGAGPVQDRRLALEDGDERVARVADPEQVLALGGRALLAAGPEDLELPRGEDRAERTSHPSEGTAR